MAHESCRRAWCAAVICVSLGALAGGQRGPLPRGAGDADLFQRLVPVPYEPRDLERFRAIWPDPLQLDDVNRVWVLRPSRGGPQTLYFIGEFRIVNWNAAGHAEDRNKFTPAADVARPILEQVDRYNANVITLQELREDVYHELAVGLVKRSFDWTCDAHEFGARVDLRVTCIKGVSTNLRVRRLSNAGPLNFEDLKNREFWGFMQVDYFGVTITNVHVRNFWDVAHVSELHREVPTGIVAGDFNYETPEESPAGGSTWFQTDVNRLVTWQDAKIDHVLTVEPHVAAQAEVVGKHGSNHEMLLTRFRFAVPFERTVRIAPFRPIR